MSQSSSDSCPQTNPALLEAIQQPNAELPWEGFVTTYRPKTWRAFELTHLREMSCQEVADKLDMSIGAFYVSRSRVFAELQKEGFNRDASSAMPSAH